MINSNMSCGTCRPTARILYRSSDGFEIEDIPGDYEYYIGTLASAITLYGLGERQNFATLFEIANVLSEYLQNDAFNHNMLLKSTLIHFVSQIKQLLTPTSKDASHDYSRDQVPEQLTEIIAALDELLYNSPESL